MNGINSNLNESGSTDTEDTTFEFVENNRYQKQCSSTKEQKQRHNEEIVMESNSNAGSWEKIDIGDTHKSIETCRNFLINEKSFNDERTTSSPCPSSKPCFIDASSLLDDEYVPYANTNQFTSNSIVEKSKYKEEGRRSSQEYDIKDQFSAITYPVRKNLSEKVGFNPFFNDDYASDVSFPSEYSSESCANSGAFHNILYENTSGYSGSTNSRLQSDVDSITTCLPETPYNSIVQIGKKLEIFKLDSDYDSIDAKRNTSSSVLIPKRAMKHDESAPILSGGASISDFAPKHQQSCDSPSVRRKTDACPIVSGGSLHIEEDYDNDDVQQKVPDKKPERERASFSWVVDLKENLKIVEACEKNVLQPSSTATPKNSLGFYVDFNEIPVTEESEKVKKEKDQKALFKKATGFFVDLSDTSCPSTPKIAKEKPSQEPPKDVPPVDDLKIENLEETLEVPNTSEGSKKGCFMFIENNASVVKHRKLLQKDAAKRHSWNVNDVEENKSKAKMYQRSTSVNIGDKEIPLSLPSTFSKTSSMSVASSLSPHDDFTCSKSLSSRSNQSITTSSTSIDQSETRVQCEERKILKKRKKEAKINETYDKSSHSSITDEIFANDESTTPSDDELTFQNQSEDAKEEETYKENSVEETKIKMETIVEKSESSSPFKKANAEKSNVFKQEVPKPEQPHVHTLESLHQLIEKQKQILETVTESQPISFVKLSDLDNPPASKKEYSFMTNSAGSRATNLTEDQKHHNQSAKNPWNMSRSTGNNFLNLASSLENSKSLSRLFPHLTKVFSNSVPNVGGNFQTEQSMFEYIEFISSDFSCTSSINSSRSGMDSADESSISCRQPRRLGEDLLKMFLQEIGTDIVIDVEGRKIKAHRVILRSRCQYFAALLAGKFIENAGNVIHLPGYSFPVVHFALCHIYSGAAHPPCGLDLMELASISDLLGIEGLKEITEYALKNNYCHNFHKPCSGCIEGVIQVLPVTLNHGLDDLYRKCVKWVCKHFIKVWTSKPFACLSFDVQQRCRQQICAHFTSENVLDWFLHCDDVLNALESCRWNNFNTKNVVKDVQDSAYTYICEHYSSLIASDSFLSLGHDRNDVILKLEHSILKAAASLSPEQACKSYPRAVRLNTLLNAKLIKFPSPLSNESFKPFDRIQLRDEDEDVQWNDDFIKLVSAMLCAVEQTLIRLCSRAIKCSAWQRMDADLRNKIQKIACLTEGDDIRRALRTSTASSMASVRSNSASSSTTSRANDLRQVKLVMQAHSRKIQTENSNIPVMKNTDKSATHRENKLQHSSTKVIVPPRIYQNTKIHKQPISDDSKHQIIETKSKFNFVKARYMEPRKIKTASDLPANQKADFKKMSSSETSSRDLSPAFMRKRNLEVKKASNLSLDSIQLRSPAKTNKNLLGTLRKDHLDVSSDSLTQTSSKLEVMSENRMRNRKDSSSSTKPTSVPKSFFTQKSREILSKKGQHERKHSTNSNSSMTTNKSTKSLSPKMQPTKNVPLSKSQSAAAVISGRKVFQTTLHLRKTSKLQENGSENNKNAKASQKVSSPLSQRGKEKTKSGNSEKTLKSKSIQSEKQSDDSFETKMARSNTFSKEADNPIEILKNMK